jgi:hypothetical protein
VEKPLEEIQRSCGSDAWQRRDNLA